MTKLTRDLEQYAMYLHNRDAEHYVGYLEDLQQSFTCQTCSRKCVVYLEIGLENLF